MAWPYDMNDPILARTERQFPLPDDIPTWLQHILRTTPDYPPGPKGPQANPKDVPIVPGSPAGQLMFDPSLGREDEQMLASGEQIRSRISAVPQSAMSASNTKGGSMSNGIFGGQLAGYEPDYAQAALKYGIDPHLLMSISMFETGNGTSNMLKTKNNVAGITNPGGGSYRSFDSIPESIDFMAKNLKNNYIDKGLTTIPQIAAKYAPVGASNDPNATNNEWPAAVGGIYSKLSGTGSGSPSRSALIAPSPVTGGSYASGTNAGAMGMYDPSFNYGGAPSQTATTIAGIGSALGGILQSLGKSQSQGTGTDPLKMLSQPHKLAWYAPAQFPTLPYT